MSTTSRDAQYEPGTLADKRGFALEHLDFAPMAVRIAFKLTTCTCGQQERWAQSWQGLQGDEETYHPRTCEKSIAACALLPHRTSS